MRLPSQPVAHATCTLRLNYSIVPVGMDTERVLRDLLSLSQSCKSSHHTPAAYSSPAYLDFYDLPMSIHDIPMQSYNIEKSSRGDPNSVPWDDSVKNLVFDLGSIPGSTRNKVCLVLAGRGYKYSRECLPLVYRKYCTRGGISVVAEENEAGDGQYNISIYDGQQIDDPMTVDAETAPGLLLSLCIYDRTVILCHDSSSEVYKSVLYMAVGATWSVQCTSSNFVEPGNGSNSCKYICPVYSCLGLHESRAVGRGNIVIGENPSRSGYAGRLNYYSRCIRGSACSSGKCYDCEVLYRTVAAAYETPPVSSAKRLVAQMSPDFLSRLL